MNRDAIYKKQKNLITCWANAENPQGVKGAAGKANEGRKGAPAIRPFLPDQSVVLAQAKGSGMIRHIWITFENHTNPKALKGFKLECFWDGCEKPAVSVPIGDFCCCNSAQQKSFENIFFSDPEGRSFNCFIPMPFKEGMKIVFTNETDIVEPQLFYQVDYTLGDEFGEDILYFHAYYNREASTKTMVDYTILPRVNGCGKYLGASFGVITNPIFDGTWWGEGEVKCYIDGDSDYPSLCGTGTEDYIGTGWGQGVYNHMRQGCLLADYIEGRFSFYRFHDADPVVFENDIRITIQQIGCSDPNGVAKMRDKNIEVYNVTGKDEVKWNTLAGALFERYEDDWCSVAYFYLDRPESNLPLIPSSNERIKKYIMKKIYE